MKFEVVSNKFRYPLSILLAIVAVSIQYVIIVYAQIAVPGILYPFTFMVAWFFGFGPAMVCIVISLIGSYFLFYEPRFTLKVLRMDDGIRMGIFAITSFLSALIVAKGKTAKLSESIVKSAYSELEFRFKRSSSATNLGIWYCDLPFAELIWNKEVKEHFWLPEDTKVDINLFYERIHPDDREKTRKAIDDAIKNHSAYDLVYRTTHPDDSKKIKYIRALGWTEYSKDGKPIRFDGYTLDVTQFYLVSNERNESLEVLGTIYEMGKFMSAELNHKKLVQKITDAATQLTKADFGAFFYNMEDDKGQHYTLYTISGVPIENFTKFPMPRNTDIFSVTFKGEGVLRSDDITKDPRYGHNAPYFGMPKGHLPVVSYLAVPVFSRTGEVIGGLFFGSTRPAVFSDKEERIVVGLASQAAIAMDNATLFDKVNQAIEIRDEFLSICSHELRTPLTPLKMQLQTLARHLDRGTFSTLSEERLKEVVKVADRQVNRLATLVEDLLDVSRISSGKLTLNYETIDLAEVIKENLERYDPQIKNAKCEIVLNLESSLQINIDKLRFEQVFINLLTNALKYASGTPIHISARKNNDHILLQIKDHGQGILLEDQKRIFDRFERVKSNSNQGGLGLGLYIVNQIVEAHGGKITVKSETEKGTAFNVTFPFHKEDSST